MRGRPRRCRRTALGLAVAALLLGAGLAAWAPSARAGDETLPPPQVIVRRGARRPPAPSPAPPVRPPAPAPAAGQPGPPPPSDADLPFLPPERPPERMTAGPGDVDFDVAREGGLLRAFPEGDDDSEHAVIVMLGNPRIHRPAFERDGEQAEALTIKANTLVAWVDRRGIPQLDAFSGLGRTEHAAGVPLEPSASVIPDFLDGIYAEGAVELTFGELSFRAESLYVEPKTYRALLLEPRFDGRSIGIEHGDRPLPLHVRARRARLVARGLTVFDDAEVSASRADDRIALQVVRLTAEELNPVLDERGVEKPHALGYQADSSQWYSARTLTLRGERVPFFWLPRADFGYSRDAEALTSPVKGVRVGRKSEVGRFAFVRLGFPLGDERDPLATLFVEPGGYLDRGVAAGVDVVWDHSAPGERWRGLGKLETFGVLDNKTFDSDGFVHGKDLRGRIALESRTWLRDDLLFDLEVNELSDRGFNNEFFERDDLHHKDRESYARLRWAPARPGYAVATLDWKWHQRPWVTETLEQPQAGLWLLPVPLLTPARRGGLALDVTARAKAGHLVRAYDEDLLVPDVEAWRLHADTRLNAAVDAGDVRLSAYVGGIGTVYQDRTDGFRDVTRSALQAGLRANLQLHRSTEARGGWFGLDGLRHVVDLDVEAAGRFWDSHAPAGVPAFDGIDAERERTAGILRVRNRWETRRRDAAGAPGGLRTVADLEVALMGYLDDKGPYGHDSPGALELTLAGAPREDLDVSAELTLDLDRGVETGSLGAGVRADLLGRPLRLFGGVRHVRDRSTSFTADLSWRFSEKYGLRLLEVVDLDEGENLTRLRFRRHSEDHILVFGFSLRNGDDLGLELSFEPAIGGVTTRGAQSFKDEPDPDPWGTFGR